jgi:hypothetical protein
MLTVPLKWVSLSNRLSAQLLLFAEKNSPFRGPLIVDKRDCMLKMLYSGGAKP